MNFKLREWRITDANAVVKHANNHNIAKNLTNAFPHPYTRDDAESYIKQVSQQSPTQVFAIDINGEAVGSIGIFPQDDIHAYNAEIGYWLSEDYWGQGIMTEAIRQITDYGFQTFPINRIFARPFGTNTASQKVLQKAGFKQEAKFEKALFKEGVFLDEYIFALRKS